MTRLSLALAALLACSPPALASVTTQMAAVDAKLKSCMTKDDSNLGMKTCTGEAYGAADKILNTLYGSITTQLKSPTSPDDTDNTQETLRRLVASERAWVTYRDANCSLEGVEMLGGSGESLVIVDCLLTMTKQRAKSLDDLLNAK